MNKRSGPEIQVRRRTAGISGYLLSQRAGISRSQLSHIETGQVVPSPDALAALDGALDELIAAQQKVFKYAIEQGYPLTAAWSL